MRVKIKSKSPMLVATIPMVVENILTTMEVEDCYQIDLYVQGKVKGDQGYMMIDYEKFVSSVGDKIIRGGLKKVNGGRNGN
jgi:hypothetical protein